MWMWPPGFRSEGMWKAAEVSTSEILGRHAAEPGAAIRILEEDCTTINSGEAYLWPSQIWSKWSHLREILLQYTAIVENDF